MAVLEIVGGAAMHEISEPLSRSPVLNEGTAAKLFNDTTTYYKYLFFGALLGEFRGADFLERRFTVNSPMIGMLAAARYPARVCRLSLGFHDQVATLLSGIDLGDDGQIVGNPPAALAITHKSLTLLQLPD